MRPGTGRILPWATSTRPVLTLVDPLAAVVAGLLVLPSGSPLLVLAAAGFAALVGGLTGLHRPRLVLSVVEDLPGLVVSAAAAVLVVLAGPGQVAPARVATFGVAVFAASLLARTAVQVVTHLLRRSGLLTRRVVVVGTGSVGRHLALTLLSRRELGLTPVGFVDCAPPGTLRGLPLSMLGDVGDLSRVMRRLEVHDIVVAPTSLPDDVVASAVRTCLADGHQVHVVPRSYEVTGRERCLVTELIDDVAVARLSPRQSARPVRAVRRVVEAAVAVCGLVVLAPLLVVLALAVRVESGPGVLVRRTRVGMDGRTFTVHRFRSVRPAELTSETTSWTVAARRGPVGRFLRVSGLGELPQLVDVVRGDLSLDGRDGRAQSPAGPAWWERPARPLP